MRTVLLAAATIVAASAQDLLGIIPWEKLQSKATEVVDVNLDSNMISMARRFLGGEEQEVKNLLGKLKAIHVKVLKFDKEGEYAMSDVEQLRSKLAAPGWSPIVDVRSKGKGNTGIYVKTSGDLIEGLVVLAAEPKELTMVNIIGSIDPADLEKLSGKMGIPPIAPKKTQKKEDE